ncbi:ABC transporter permease [Jonesiaceae bacterium BS-20]|uniref:ABC transporter permease n=1 Tax=Jonesiaceae bacterium BS-20 TaxID=3120821 RepID=A0AAU7DVR2_9MICO
MAELLEQIINGLAMGSVYAVVALGFALVFGVAKVVNFAQGSQVMVGAYLAWAAATAWGLSLPLAFLVAVVGSVAISIIIEIIAVEWLGDSAEIAPLLSTLALAFILDQGVRLIWSPNPVRFPNPLSGHNVSIGPITVSATDLFILGATLLFLVVFVFLFKSTWVGRSIRAAAQDPVAASQMGVRTGPAKMTVFGMAGFLGALGGVLVGIYFQQIDPAMGLPFGLKGFAAAMVGGVVSLTGAVIGGLLIGVFEALAGGYLGAAWRDLVAFGLLLVVLIVRPQGLLGSKALLGLGGSRGAGAIPTTSPLADSSGFPVTVMGTRNISMKWTLGITLAIGLFATFGLGNYWSGVMAQGAIFATAALGMTVLTGMTGYVSVGHNALLGVGAYLTARMAVDLGWPFELVLVVVVVLSLLAGLIFALPILGLSGHTIALASLALGQIGYLIMLNWMPATRGPLGIGGIPEPKFALLGGNSLTFNGSMTAICFLVLLIGLGIVAMLQKGQISLNLRSIREDRLAADAFGVNTTPYITIAFMISSVLAGLAGMMFAYQQSFVSPDSFLILFAFLLLTIVLFGGIVSPLGAVIGGIVLIAIPEFLREYSQYRELVYGVILILVIKFLPSGVTSLGAKFSARAGSRIALAADGITESKPSRTESESQVKNA